MILTCSKGCKKKLLNDVRKELKKRKRFDESLLFIKGLSHGAIFFETCNAILVLRDVISDECFNVKNIYIDY